MAEIVLTRDELRCLADYADTQSVVRTYRLVRDTKNVLHVCNQDGRLVRLTPALADTRSAP